MTEAETTQELILLIAFIAGLVAGMILGFTAGSWIVAPLANTSKAEEYRQRVSEQRERRTCLIVALLCYYIPALIIVGLHAGMAGILPYLRDHLLDGFGCSALFVLALAPLRLPVAEASEQYKPGLAAVGQAARASLLLTGGSVAIACSAAWIAGGAWSAVLVAGGCTIVAAQFFWGFVSHIISMATLAT
jgi:hypothetical protein